MDTTTLSFTETTDPNIIQEWAEVRGGTPARDLNDETKLKIIFDESSEDMGNLQKISWEEFFELFKENQYKFYYQPEDEEADDGELSRDYKIEKGESESNEEGMEEDNSLL